MALNAASEKKLARVKANLVSVVRRASEISSTPFQIVQGNRTQAEQNALYAQGRTKRGNIVTWTKNSKHIGGNAIDFAALVNGKINWNTKYYTAIVDAFKKAAMELKVGIEAGIDWKTKDWGHIQLSTKSPTPLKPTAGVGWTISDIQNALVKHGFDPGDIDGIMGKKTRDALVKFQKAKGLEQTASPDVPTTTALAKAKASNFIAKFADLGPEAVTVDAEYGSPKWAYQYMQSLGWSRMASIAIVANLIWESGGHDHINWSAHGDSNHSHGAGQWNDRLGRYQELVRFAEESHKEWYDPETQMKFIDKELRWSEKKTGAKLLNVNNVNDAMDAAIGYWRPSVPHLDKRKKIAEALEKEYEDDDVSISTGDSDSSSA